MLNWLPGGAHVPIFYAKGAGHYKKAGIDAEILSTRGSRDALAALGKGEAQFALVEASELFSQRTGGIEATGGPGIIPGPGGAEIDWVRGPCSRGNESADAVAVAAAGYLF